MSLKYGVICQHTSFVAVSLKEVPGKKPERIEIPVNLPVGWNFESVFGTPHQIMAFSAGFKGSRGLALQSLGASINSIKLCESGDVSLDSFAGGVPKMRRIKSGIRKIKKSIGAIGKFPRRPIPSVPKIPTLPKRPQIPTPQVPVPPIPASVTSKRFVLDAKDIVDRAIGILVALGAGKRNEAEKAFKQLEKELTLQKIKKLSDEKKAMLKYFLRRIAWYGFSVDEKIMAKLTWKKETSETKVWAYLALREEGSAPVTQPAVPSRYEASEYISWKLGKAQKPVVSEWAVVP